MAATGQGDVSGLAPDPPRARGGRLVPVRPGLCPGVGGPHTGPGTAEYLAALPGVTVLDLDLSAALAVARDTSWAQAHTRYAAGPTAERPGGAVVATTAPEAWKGQPVRGIDLTP